MTTEVASALMFQNFEKHVHRSSIFNKVATVGPKMNSCFFKVSDHSTESEAYSEPCQTSKMERFARNLLAFSC